MHPLQESHLSWVLSQATKRIEAKYKAGDKEHGGEPLIAIPTTKLIDWAIEEAVDQVVYLLSIRRQLDEIPDEAA